MSTQLAPSTAQAGVRPLEGKGALVTGGSRGIGAAIVRRLTTDGAQVAFTYASAKDQADAVVEATGALAMQADNSDHKAVRAAVSRTTEHFGGLDILVNNAGVAHMAPIEDVSLEEFDRLIAVNVRGVFSAVQAAAAHLGQGGRIITIGSVSADRAPRTRHQRLRPDQSRRHRFHPRPGPRTRSARHHRQHRAAGPHRHGHEPRLRPGRGMDKQLTTVGHYGKPADITSAVAYLASPEARFVTGTTWNVDGGSSI